MKTSMWFPVLGVCLATLSVSPAHSAAQELDVYAHYRHVGCFRDNATTRAIGSNRPLFNNATAIADCAAFAVAMPAHAFGVQMGNSDKGTCFVKTDAHETYERYGQLNDKDCIRGRGGSYRNSVYLLASQVRAPFTQVPPDSTFVVHGSIANLTWNVSAEVNHSYVEFLRDYSGSWAWLLRKFNNATVITNNALPSNVTSKLSVEGSATLVISNFSSSDAGKYECRLVQPAEKTTTEAPVHLLLAGGEAGNNSCAKSICEQICVSTDATAQCGCRRGFELLPNSTCVDIDECARQDTCRSQCDNEIGSVKCSCPIDQDTVRGSAQWNKHQSWLGSLTYWTDRDCRLKRCWKTIRDNITWPTTDIRKTAIVPCPTGENANAHRRCEFKSQKGTWDDPDFTKCVATTPVEAKPTTNSNVEENTEPTSGSVKGSEGEEPTDRYTEASDDKKVQEMDNDITSVENATLSPEQSKEHLKRFSGNLGAFVEGKLSPDKMALAVQKSEQMGAALAQAMRRSGNLSGPVTVQVSTPSLEMGITILPADNKSSTAPVVFPAAGAAERVDLPGSLIALANEKGKDGVAINSILVPNVVATSDPKSKRTLNSGILATTVLFVDSKEFQNLEEPVVISLSHKKSQKENEKSVCAYLNVTGSPATWASRGCQVNATNATYTVCHCYHATSFAVLMDVHGMYDGDSIPKDHQLALSIISVVGCTIAFVCFVLVLLALIVSRRRTETVSVHKNFAFAQILALFFFLVSYAAVPVKGLCFAVAVLLHYFLLCVFCWMFVEGVNIHRGMVKVFRTADRMHIYCAIGWGTPLVVVGISAGYAREHYVRDDFCWLAYDFIWAFAGPAAFILLANFIILFMAIKVMVRRTQYRVKRGVKVKPEEITVSKEIKAAFKTLVVLAPLLGVTWVLGYMTVRETSLVFHYFFTVINTLQGLYFLFAQLFFDDEIRRTSMLASTRIRRTLSSSLSRSKSRRSPSTSSVTPAPNSKPFNGAWPTPHPTLTRKGPPSGNSKASQPETNNKASMDTKF